MPEVQMEELNMLNERTREDYQNRILRVVDYIHDHLDDELDTNILAGVACFSPYHWHRIYHAMTGETAAQTVRRLRLHRAAADLQLNKLPITVIASRAGYSSTEAFNRAFRRAYQLPPATFRQTRETLYKFCNFVESDINMYEVEIKKIEPFALAAIPHKGSYMEIGRAFDRLMIWAHPRGLINDNTRMIAVYHDDPNEIPEKDLKSYAGIVIDNEKSIEEPASIVKVPAGICAVLTHKGPYSDLNKAYLWLFGQWLPKSGYEAGDGPCFEEYLNDPRSTSPNELLTLVCLPLNSGD